MTEFKKGQTLGGYEIREELGRGGMGVVYRAVQPSLGRIVAVKVLPPLLAMDSELVERFMREARAMATLDHPGIVTIHDVGEAEGSYYFAMQFLEGRSLVELIAEEAPLDPATALGVTVQVASALGYAHRRGVIHRDIKPGNMMLDHEGRIVLLDFGIARANTEIRLTRTGTVVGSPEYMSPEQVAARSVDHRSDLYALGVVIYQMLTGVVPYQGDTAVSVAYQHVHEPVKSPRDLNPEVTPEVDAICRRLMEKNPEDRFQSAEELLVELQGLPLPGGQTLVVPQLATPLPGTSYAHLTPVPTPRPGPASPTPPPAPTGLSALGRQRRLLALLGIAVSALGLALLIGLWSYLRQSSSRLESPAEEIPTVADGTGGDASTPGPDAEASEDPTVGRLDVLAEGAAGEIGAEEGAESPQTPRTMAILRSNVRDDVVTLDGRTLGSTPQEVEVEAGPHVVEITKTGCEPASRRFEVPPGESLTLFLTLSCPLAEGDAIATGRTGSGGPEGRLTLRPSVEGARIEVDGLGAFDGVVADVGAEPGLYRFTVTCPVCVETTGEVEVRRGETTEIDFEVEADPAKVQTLLAEGWKSLDRGDYEAASDAAFAILAHAPDAPAALRLGAEAAYFRNLPAQFSELARRALAAGSEVRLPMLYQQQLGAKLYECRLTIGPDLVEFEPATRLSIRGRRKPFSEPRTNLRSAELEHREDGNLWLMLELGEPGKSKRTKLRLAHHDTVMVRAQEEAKVPLVTIKVKGHSMQLVPEAEASLEAVRRLLLSR